MTGPSNPVRMETASRLCPDSEVLAAFLDQGLGADESVQVEAHLAGCDRCRVIAARVLDTWSAVQQTGAAASMPGTPGASRRTPAFSRAHVAWGAGSLLAAAAVLAVMFNVGTRSKLADLAAAVGDERPIEARLTGGFRYGPVRAPVRSGGSSAASDDWTLYAAAGRIREDADRDPSAPNLHALGVAHLVLGQYDEAVRALEDAIAEDPDQPHYHSDLAAAYLARANELDRPDDLPRALGAAERAVKGRDTLLEARFNRALALEALFLNDQARQAWEDYLSRDSSSGWASDARAHLQKLQPSAAPQEGARNNSPPPITDTSVEAAFDWLLRHGLPAWAEALLANASDQAAQQRLALSDYAQQLSVVSGDSYANDLVRGLDTATSPTRATAILTFGQSLERFDQDDMPGLEVTLTPGCADAPSAIAVLCDFYLGIVDVLKRREDRVTQRVERLRAVSEVNGWLHPLHLSRRLQGYQLLFASDYRGAFIPCKGAYEGFVALRLFNSAANVASQLADISDILGLSAEGWRWRLASLRLAARTAAPNIVYITRLQTSGALVAQREPEAAATVINGIDETASNSATGLRRAILGIARARAAIAIDDRDTALNSLTAARLAIDASPDFRARRLLTEALTVQASIEERNGEFERARATLASALAAMGPERASHRAAVHLERASLARTNDSRSEAAADIDAAIALLSTHSLRDTDQPLRFEEAETALTALGALLSIDPNLRSVRGLQLVERIRDLLNTGSGASLTEDDLDVAIKQQPPGTLVVSLLSSSDSVLGWVLSTAGVEFVTRTSSAPDVTRAVNALTVAVTRSPSREDVWRPILAELYDSLLRDLPGLSDASEIVVVPDAYLARVPFGALYDRRSRKYLFERSTVRMSPTLQLALRDRKLATTKSPRDSALVVGDPQLAGDALRTFQPLARARSEAFKVARLYKNARVLIGQHATKTSVLQALADADVIHYAGHAVTAGGRRDARLLLAGDIADPQLALRPADLRGKLTKPVRVVLAACETASGFGDRASGLASLSSGFLRAGAASVVATLWPVDDAGSEAFFSTVHHELADGQTTTTAVARAQKACHGNAECRRSAPVWIGTTVYGSQ